LVNQLLQAIGLKGVGWLTDPNVAMLSIVWATLWWTAGFNMILFSAGMKQIPDEIYESARLDGAGKFVTLTRITIPLLKDTTLLVVILQIIASFKVFGQVYVMTGGGPYGTTRVLVQYVYETGFNYFKLGYASAMSMVLFVVILVISAVQLLASKDDVQ
jgi:multiple sugar transport system permease protein